MPTTAAAVSTTPSPHDAETAEPARDRAGWVSASDLLAASSAGILEVDEPVASLFAQAGPRRGDVGVVAGSSSLLLAILARPSRQGRWCVVVGAPGLGLAAAGEAGVELARLVLIPHPGRRWEQVVAALLDTFEVVVACPPEPVAAATARRLAAITRRQRAVLIVNQPEGARFEDARFEGARVEGARWRLRVVGQQWQGIADGGGHLQARRLDVEIVAKTPAVRRTTTIWLPSAPAGTTSAGVAAAEVDAVVPSAVEMVAVTRKVG